MPHAKPNPRPRIPASRRLARRRRLRRAAAIALVLLAASIVMSHAGPLGRAGDDWSRFDRRRVHVAQAVDGNTLVVLPAAGPAARVRLLGVAAPGDDLYWAEPARRYVAGRVEGKEVTLRLEPTQPRDPGGNLLAFVYAADTDNLNLEMIREGHAYADRRQPHSFKGQFNLAEGEARQRRRGLWRSVAEAQMPVWRQDWLRDQRDRRQGSPPPATRPSGR